MGGADETVAVGTEGEDLAAPDRLVAPVTGAVEGDADDGFANASVLGQQRHDVRVMVLDQVQRPAAGAALGPLAGVVPRVQVGGQSGRRAADFGELAHGALERAQRLPAGYVADVAGQVRPRSVGEAERVLQFAAHGEHRRAGRPEIDG